MSLLSGALDNFDEPDDVGDGTEAAGGPLSDEPPKT
jgi:hypothetical protein